mgnify:CR=1 FL=1
MKVGKGIILSRLFKLCLRQSTTIKFIGFQPSSITFRLLPYLYAFKILVELCVELRDSFQ